MYYCKDKFVRDFFTFERFSAKRKIIACARNIEYGIKPMRDY